MPYGVLITEEARASLQRLGRAAFWQVRRAMEGYAELADVSPPVDDTWHPVAALAPPLMRTHVSGYRVLYDVDPDERLLRVIDVSEDPLIAR